MRYKVLLSTIALIAFALLGSGSDDTSLNWLKFVILFASIGIVLLLELIRAILRNKNDRKADKETKHKDEEKEEKRI